jgi:hypothetical protein
LDDSKEFLVVNFVVALGSLKSFGVERDWVLLSVLWTFLREHTRGG